MIVREYWPAFVDRSDEPRQQFISSKDEIHTIPWVIEKGPVEIDGWAVMRRGFVVATILNDDLTATV